MTRLDRYFCYAMFMLFIVMAFAPETYGVSLKFAFIPLFLTLSFTIASRRYHFRMNMLQILTLLYILILTISTIESPYVSCEPKFRSTILMIAAYFFISCYTPSNEQMQYIKNGYIICSLACGFWIMYSVASLGLFGLDRYNFNFIYFQKDVNYLLAFLIPPAYLSARSVFLEKKDGIMRTINIMNISFTTVGILSLQSRAALVTYIVCAGLLFFEYNLQTRMSCKKIFISVSISIGVLIAYFALMNNDSFSRLTDKSGYEDNIRLFVWECAMQAYRESPIIGSGLGASSLFSEKATGFQTHNNYMDILGDSGIVGIIIFSLIFIILYRVKKGYRTYMLTLMIACLVPLGFVNGFQTVTFWVPMMLLSLEHNMVDNEAILIVTSKRPQMTYCPID